jgi:chitinase
MLIIVIASTTEQAVVVAQNIIHEGYDAVSGYYHNYIETTSDAFVCASPADIAILAPEYRPDVVFMTEAAYESTKDDVVLSEIITNLPRLGPSMIIVNDDPDLLVD